MFKVRINDGAPEDVATLRLGWRAIDRSFAQLGPDGTLIWSIEAFDGSRQREAMSRSEWQHRFRGPLAFSRFLEAGPWRDRAGEQASNGAEGG